MSWLLSASLCPLSSCRFWPYIYIHMDICINPLTEEIWIEIFGSPDLPISGSIFWRTGSPFTHVKSCLKWWGLPWKRVWYVWGLQWKLVVNFGSRDYYKSDLLRGLISLVGFFMWLRLVGSLKLQVSFAKDPYKRDDILQKYCKSDLLRLRDHWNSLNHSKAFL